VLQARDGSTAKARPDPPHNGSRALLTAKRGCQIGHRARPRLGERAQSYQHAVLHSAEVAETTSVVNRCAKLSGDVVHVAHRLPPDGRDEAAFNEPFDLSLGNPDRTSQAAEANPPSRDPSAQRRHRKAQGRCRFLNGVHALCFFHSLFPFTDYPRELPLTRARYLKL